VLLIIPYQTNSSDVNTKTRPKKTRTAEQPRTAVNQVVVPTCWSMAVKLRNEPLRPVGSFGFLFPPGTVVAKIM